MGYSSTITGRIEVDPPLKMTEVAKGSMFLAPREALINFEVTETSKSTEDGDELIQRRITAIVPASEDSVKAYDLEDELRSALAYVKNAKSGAFGELVVMGEEQGDVWRLVCTGGTDFVKEDAKLTWPDGSIVTEVEL